VLLVGAAQAAATCPGISRSGSTITATLNGQTIQLEASGADVSAAALFKDTSDLPEGDINYGNIFDIYKYDNTLYRVKLTGAELKEYMEWSAGYYNTWKEGDINISFDPEFRDYKYDMFAGVDYEIDISKPVGERITNLKYQVSDLRMFSENDTRFLKEFEAAN